MLPSFNSTVELVTDEVFARKDKDSSKLSVQSEELKSVKEWKETSSFSARRRSHHEVISQSKDDQQKLSLRHTKICQQSG